MIQRLIPKYPTFLVLGLVIVASGLLLMTAVRDSLIAVWTNKLIDGETQQGVFQACPDRPHPHGVGISRSQFPEAWNWLRNSHNRPEPARNGPGEP